jgi:hypothetical protein
MDEDREEHEGNYTDLSATIVLNRPGQSGEQVSYNDTADNSFQLNAHMSHSRPSQPVQYPDATHPAPKHPNPDTTTAREQHKKEKPITAGTNDTPIRS